MSDGIPAPPLDLPDYRRRAHAIHQARVKAREALQEHGLAESDADHAYHIERAKRLDALRSAGKAQAEALALAEGDVVVAGHKRTRDRAQTMKRVAQARIDECERGAATLNREAQMGEGIER